MGKELVDRILESKATVPVALTLMTLIIGLGLWGTLEFAEEVRDLFSGSK